MSLFQRILRDTTDLQSQVAESVVNQTNGIQVVNKGHDISMAAVERTRKHDAQRETEKLKQENEKLQQVAINVALDRKAIYNTINYLAGKWGKKIDQTEIDQHIETEYQKLKQDKNLVERKKQEIQETVRKIKKTK